MLRGGGGIFQCSFCNIHCCCLAPCVKHCWPLQSWSWGFSHLGDSPPKSAAPEDNCLSKILTKSVTCSHTSFSRREDKIDGTADSLFLNVLKHWILVSQRCGLRYARYKVRRERKECCWCSLTAVVLNFGFPFLCSGVEQAVDLFQQEVRRCYDSCVHLRHVGTGHSRHTVWADEARAMALRSTVTSSASTWSCGAGKGTVIDVKTDERQRSLQFSSTFCKGL